MIRSYRHITFGKKQPKKICELQHKDFCPNELDTRISVTSRMDKSNRTITINQSSPKMSIFFEYLDLSMRAFIIGHAKSRQGLYQMRRRNMQAITILTWIAGSTKTVVNGMRRLQKTPEFFNMSSILSGQPHLDALTITVNMSVCHQESSPISGFLCHMIEYRLINGILSNGFRQRSLLDSVSFQAAMDRWRGDVVDFGQVIRRFTISIFLANLFLQCLPLRSQPVVRIWKSSQANFNLMFLQFIQDMAITASKFLCDFLATARLISHHKPITVSQFGNIQCDSPDGNAVSAQCCQNGGLMASKFLCDLSTSPCRISLLQPRLVLQFSKTKSIDLDTKSAQRTQDGILRTSQSIGNLLRGFRRIGYFKPFAIFKDNGCPPLGRNFMSLHGVKDSTPMAPNRSRYFLDILRDIRGFEPGFILQLRNGFHVQHPLSIGGWDLSESCAAAPAESGGSASMISQCLAADSIIA